MPGDDGRLPKDSRPKDTILPGTFSLGRLAGVPVRVHWSVLIIMALIASGLTTSVFPAAYPDRPEWQYVVAGVVAAVVFLLGLLAHEVSHAVVAGRNGVGTSSITLWLLGGVAQLSGEAPTPGAQLRIAGVGPLVSLLLGVAFFGSAWGLSTAGVTGLLVGALAWLGWINVLLAAFNLLPGAPLDGGRLLHAALWKWRGDRQQAAVTAARVGRGLGVLFIGLAVADLFLYGDVSAIWLVIVGWFIVAAAANEERAARVAVALAGVRVRDVMTPFPDTVPAETTVAGFVDEHLLAHRHSTFPLTDQGRPAGLLTLARVRQVSREDRPNVALRDIGSPLDEVLVLAPDELLAGLLPRLQQGDDVHALVLDEGRLVGIVSPVDVTRAVEAAKLRAAAPTARSRG